MSKFVPPANLAASNDFGDDPYLMVFTDSEDRRVGRLFVSPLGSLAFEGNAEDSARILFEAVIKRHDLALSKAHLQIIALEQKLAEMGGSHA